MSKTGLDGRSTRGLPLWAFVGLLIPCATVLCAPGSSLAWVQIGDSEEAIYETPHPCPAGASGAAVWEDVIHREGASYIAVHFEAFDFAPGDRVVLSDPAGQYAHVYAGKGYMDKGGDFWGLSVTGDTLVVTVYSGGTAAPGYGYRIDRFAHGYPLPKGGEGEGPESVCGSTDWEDAVCYASSYPEVYGKGRAVVKLLYNGDSHCTGWLVSCENHIFTNEHCVTSQAQLDQIEFQFMYQAPACGSGTPTYELQLQGGTFLQDNADLDYCLLIPNLDGNDPQATYGYIQIDNRLPDIDEQIYIIGHPRGLPKKISLLSTHAEDPSGFCEVYSTDQTPCAGGPGDIGYYCDTDGGSSGSPVLSRGSDAAVALHHCANCPNRGVPITAIYDDAGSLLPGCSIYVDECFDNDGDGYGDPGSALCTHPQRDCDDTNPDINPGVLEGPDGDPTCGDTLDNDCDDDTDLDDLGCVPCVDTDGDGYGADASGNCTYPEADCDDTNPDANPGATEGPFDDPTCSDGFDNDCDGLTDLLDVDDCVEYYLEELVSPVLVGGGEAQNWRADDDCWTLPLPFSFPYFESSYDSVYVCSNGYLDFTNNSSDHSNTEAEFRGRVMIAPMWDDIRTDGTGEDIYVLSSTDSVAIRWAGSTYSGGYPVSVEVVLYDVGVIRFNYGAGNTGLTPTIGISNGDDTFFYFSPHSDHPSLTYADTDRYVPLGVTCTDVDGDGYGSPASPACDFTVEDCDDGNPAVNPGAAEVCDGIDNNCADGADEEPLASASCDNGTFCDGEETCVAGSCEVGTDPCPDDGLFCTGVEGCDELGDACTTTGDPCVDGNDCTDDTCDEGGDVCDNPCNATLWTDACCLDGACTGVPVCEVPICSVPADCDDGLFCNGAEDCVDSLCALGTDPCADGNACTDDACDEVGDVCTNDCNASDWTDPCCLDAVCAEEPICVEPTCIDNDGDGYGDPASEACEHPELDCDDADPATHPGAVEDPGPPDRNCNGNDDCFIATAAFGGEREGKIDVLRAFRDRYLLASPAGEALVRAYYRYSPPVAESIARHGWLRAVARVLLLPVVGLVSLLL